MQNYPNVQSDVSFPTLEREVLDFWQREGVFEQSVAMRPAEIAGASNAYVFYDGPPFANGLPHHGHLLTGYVKDMVARYQTMKGRRVERRFGWDCHGLPAEMEAEKQLGVSGRANIMEYGVEKFNAHCRTSVMAYRSDWEAYVNRQARWVDFANDYKTMDTPYMESVLWAFSELHKKGLIYEGFKVMPYSWAAETVLSTSEIRMDDATREKVDKAITVAFKLKEKPQGAPEADEYYLLAWTTTPWTLPSNLALAVSADMKYVCVVTKENKAFIFSESSEQEMSKALRDLNLFDIKEVNESSEIIAGINIKRKNTIFSSKGREELSGENLIGLEYEPLFPYFSNESLFYVEGSEITHHANAFRVLDGNDFIEAGAGTGIVHMAPAFGEDDMRICAANGIEPVVPVDSEGKHSKEIYDISYIETENCIMRIPKHSDLEDFISLQTNQESMAMMNGGLRTREQATKEFHENRSQFRVDGYSQWFIYSKQTKQFMGRAGISHIKQSDEMPARPTLRCSLLPEFWGEGYGLECSRAAIDFGFTHLGVNEIAGGAHPENKAAQRMMQSIGMQNIKNVLFNQSDMVGPYFLIKKDEWKRETDNTELYLSLKGLNVICEVQGKHDDEPYTDAQLQKYGLANLRIIQWLKANGRLIKQEDYAHNYPHCWRTDKPIIYKAMSSWFVDVPKIRDRMVELNQQINWIPEHVKDGRFGKWIEGAREWSISRSRFWGCPIPVWRSDNPQNDQLYVFGSIAELEDFFNTKVEDLHKPFIDTLTKPCPLNPAYTLRRVDEVFDCWFESGSMPYAQVHYPFENKEWFEANFPADFIVEYEAQTRGWFYNMMVLSVALFDRIPFKNCICHGVVLDGEGRKLSKKLKNYANPMELFDVYGSDGLRWFMLSSTIMRGNELFLDAEGAFIRDSVRLYIKPLWSAYNFFCLYANADGINATFDLSSENIMDKYILAKLKACVEAVQTNLDAYNTPEACVAITAFLEVLNNWYIRRNKTRFWGEAVDSDKMAAYNTLYSVLHVMCRVVAPLLPQVSEVIFAGLVNGGELQKQHSVHLQNFPTELAQMQDDAALMQAMDRVQDVCNTAHAIRNEVNIRTRQPLATLTIYGANINAHPDYFKGLIADEVNVKAVVFSDDLEAVATRNLKISFPLVGKRLPTKMKAIAAAAKASAWQINASGAAEIEGEVLQPNEFEFTLQSTIKEGAVRPLPAQDGLLLLDTNLTETLLSEGVARDVVRLIQQSRKDAGLNVADRIALAIDAPANVLKAITEHQGYVCEQTLTSNLSFGKAQSTHTATHAIGDANIILAFDIVGENINKRGLT